MTKSKEKSIIEEHILTKLINLTKINETKNIKDILENLPTNIKGKIFELYTTELFKGNGWLAVQKGGKNDKGADILLYHPNNPNEVSLIVQIKNQKSPLSFDRTRIELIKFEEKSKTEYKCNQYMLISINDYVFEAKKLEEFNMRLENWDYIEDLIKRYDPLHKKTPEIELYNHNKTSFKNILERWKTSNQTAVIQPTGSGKSFLILKTLMHYPNKKSLILSSTNIAIKQIKRNEHLLSKNTHFMTYSKLSKLTKKQIKSLNLEIIILDEFHRCGAGIWSKNINNLLKLNPDAKILGTSATPIRFLDDSRNMTEEIFHNNIANKMSLTEAIIKDILPLPQYISCLYSLEEEISKMNDKINNLIHNKNEKDFLKSQLKKIELDWEKSYGVPEILKSYVRKDSNKFIVFCKDKRHLEQMEWLVESWFKKADFKKRIKKYRVFSGEKGNRKELKTFEQEKETECFHLLFVIDMLNEGFHLKDIDGVILLRPTESPTIFYQQIGRAIQVGGKQPLIFDFVNNFSNIRTKDFLEDLTEMNDKEEEKRQEFGLSPRTKIFKVIDKTINVVKSFNELDNRLKKNWEYYFSLLIDYQKENGLFINSKENENIELNNWCFAQRKLYKNKNLSVKKTQLLNGINFIWDVDNYLWNLKYNELKSFFQQNDSNHTNILENINYNKFDSWIKKQRKDKKRNNLSNKQIQLLNKINFIWDVESYLWNLKYNELKSFFQQNNPNHNNILENINYNKFDSWIKKQKENKRKNKLSNKQIQLLNKINFIWDVDEYLWNLKYNELKSFFEEKNHSNVPDDDDYIQLNIWIKKQRENKNKISDIQIKLLNEINFPWNSMDHEWYIRYEELKSFKKEFFHCSPNKEDYPTLHSFIQSQRIQFKKNTLTKEKKDILNEIDFPWSLEECNWERKYHQLIVFKRKFGKTNFIDDGIYKNETLRNWCNEQRDLHNNKKLSKRYINLLNRIDFNWDITDNWNDYMELLLKFKKIYNHLNVEVEKSNTNKALIMIVKKIRLDFTKNKIEKNKVDFLNSIGFIWSVNGYRWYQKYHELLLLKEKYGTLYFNKYIKEEKELKKWYDIQIRDFKQKKLNDNQMKLIISLGRDFKE